MSGKVWCCTGVYSNPVPTERDRLWQYLKELRQVIVLPWFLIGDFNDILSPTEQRGGIFQLSRATVFAQHLDDCCLVNWKLLGKKFTWHRKQNGMIQIHKQLDRGLSDMQWILDFPNVVIEVLPRGHSDHNPLLLRCGGFLPPVKNRPFRFEAAWCTHREYKMVVANAWHHHSDNIF
ncbi:uncharacterized protein LOC109816499 [Cajanus cajan]|uniref:uncharacterized protein LOC109816499 n=1 Tax=Cajanus cajan TaxID=3821 RepID=UPI00098D8D86|nr:uncharacterized protein LOC109816499 [Cajanus cajan]